MTQSIEPPVSYNLWSESWIPLIDIHNRAVRLGIAETLKQAHLLHSITALSPLEIVGIHRLLSAVLQATLAPQELGELAAIIETGRFDLQAIDRFGAAFAGRFDLFSSDFPFLQSADLPLTPEKTKAAKSVSYLFPEYPSGTAIVHYHHVYDNGHYICPGCAAQALTIIPPFSISGGAGIKPSINGIPPIYVLPGGKTLFESLSYSFVLPAFQPRARSQSNDQAWWQHSALVEKNQEVLEVGYLHSLTFPARRVRLHPIRGDQSCTRCGESCAWGVETIILEMGECRPKGSPFWQDPFVGYLATGENDPFPIRPIPGKVIWLEFANLFLHTTADSGDGMARSVMRPRVLDQLCELSNHGIIDNPSISMRCIGIRTDMRAKIFEWVDTSFNIPLVLLRSATSGKEVEDAFMFAWYAVALLTSTMANLFNSSLQGSKYINLKNKLRETLWEIFTEPFSLLIMELAQAQALPQESRPAAVWKARLTWYDSVAHSSLQIFSELLEKLGNDGHTLRLRSQAFNEARRRLLGQLKKEKIIHG
jgi:CRISPR system Cascade subunit CasA